MAKTNNSVSKSGKASEIAAQEKLVQLKKDEIALDAEIVRSAKRKIDNFQSLEKSGKALTDLQKKELEYAKQDVQLQEDKEKALKAEQKILSKLYELENKRKKLLKDSITDADEFASSLRSLGVQIGKDNKLFETMNTHIDSVATTLDSVGKIVADLGDDQEHLKKQVIGASDAYKNLNTNITVAGKKLMQQKTTQSQYNDLIKESYESLDDAISKIDQSTEAGKDLFKIMTASKKEMESFYQAAQKSEKELQSINQTLDSIGSSGIPMMNELSNVLKKIADKDGPGARLGLMALGAAAGALAAKYFGADMQVGIQTYYDKQQNILDGAKDLVKLGVERGFIDRKNTKLDKIGLDLIQSQIDSRNEINRLEIDRQFASQKAANQFNATMKSNTVEFQAAAKTALFGNSIGGVGYAAGQLQLAGVGADQIAGAMTAAADATGKMPTGKMGSDMAVMAARTGQSAENIAALNESFMRVDGASADAAMNMQEGLRTMAKQANINLGGLMTEMATATKDMLGYQIKSTSALARQVTFAKSMGVSFNDIAKAGQSMVLNYKDSIKSEMQLSAMLGKNVDLSEVRAKFASGDTEGAINALKAQGLDPANMDMFQQQMLQQATGMDLTTLSKINKNTGTSVGLSAGNAKAGNQSFLSRTQSAQATLASQQAIISADQAIVDAKLSQKITEAYLTSPGYLKYQQELNTQAANQAKLNTLIQEALLNSPQMQALKAKETQLGVQRTFGENVLPMAGAVAGGYALDKLGGKALGSLKNKIPTTAPSVPQPSGPLTKSGLPDMRFKANKVPTGAVDDIAKVGSKGAGMMGKMGKFAKFGGRLLGKVAGPLAIGMALYDGFQGFTADENASTGDKLMNAGSSVLNGLTFGLLGKDSDTIKAEAQAKKAGAPTPTQVAAATPGNTSIATTDKWMQEKLTYMSGNLERVVDRTHKTMMNTAQSTKELQTLNTNTKAIMNLTKTIEALTVATYQGKGNVEVMIDGKRVAYAFDKYKENTKGGEPKK